jgi:hypothetical protein
MLRTTIVYESMFGATRTVAEAIARGVREAGGAEVALRRVGEVALEDVAAADVLVVGGPTHVHSLSRPESRKGAEDWSRDPEKDLTLEPGARGTGVREFIRDLPATRAAFVAFDTRAGGPEIFTGSAANGIRKRLRKKGLRSLLPPQSFVVDGRSRLLDGEEERAAELGRTLLAEARRSITPAGASPGPS